MTARPSVGLNITWPTGYFLWGQFRHHRRHARPSLQLSAELGADVALNGGQVDAIAEVRRLTDGRGADVVVDRVGGPPGLQSFQNALDMVKGDGIIHLIGPYHGQPLALDSGKIQRKLLIGGHHVAGPLHVYADRAALN